MVKIDSTSGLADMRFSDFHQNNRQPHLPGLYLGVKFGENRWRIAIYKAFSSFSVSTDTQTNWFLRYVRVFAIAIPSVVCRLTVVCLSVTLVHPTQGVEAFGKISLPLCTLAILWLTFVQNFTEIILGEPLRRER